MAQAARLNLRMQKELKLLLTDPPPGAAFPDLSPSSDLSTFSLTAIDALIDGPEGTVYEKGVFKIKIQIPERYPFQPPVVTFSTPIYHPNIDTGGRICLDILNLPPKGAWQPSLNVSTVLTSIGLLLSEPNPDDGLMCEASKEYKYNKQVFDQKARSMTEKYARLDASPNLKGNQSLTDSNMKKDKTPEVAKTDMQEYTLGFKKFSGIGKKLSLDASGSNQSRVQERNQDSKPVMKFDQFPHHQVVHDEDNKPVTVTSRKLCLSGKNLQHEVLDSTKKDVHCNGQKENLIEFQKEPVERNFLTNPKRKKLGLTGKKPSSGFFGLAQNREKDNKGNTGSGGSSTVSKPSRKPLQILEEKKSDNKNLIEGSLGQEGLCDPEGIIVLDSEDSEEEPISSSSSRRFIARKRLLGK